MYQLPLVSIIINNFNYEKFVAEAIESAIQQTYPKVEVIVVDDGSTDHSQEIIEGYRGQIVPILKENGGQASALNAGFAASKGEIVVFLDADDLLIQSMVQDVVDVFQSKQEIIRVQYRMAVIDELSHRTGIEKPERYIPIPSGDIHREALGFPFDMAWLPTSGNVFSKTALQKIMPIPIDEYGAVGADWYLVHLTSLIGQVFFLNTVEACYRVHTSNSYEQSNNTINLEHIRQTIKYCYITSHYLGIYAKQLGLVEDSPEILSVSYIANRLVSLRLEPHLHPIPTDTRSRLITLGIKAAFQRFDISGGLKVLFINWFILMAIVHKSIGINLAKLFFFPEARRSLNPWLGRLHFRRTESNTMFVMAEDQE